MTLVTASLAFPVAALVALGASYALVIRLERIADRLHLSEIALGLVIALAANSPEITTAVSASVHGQQDIGAGVVLGSNVFNLAALLGLGSIVAGSIGLHRRVIVLEGASAMWVALITVVIVATGLGAGWGLALVLAVVIPYVAVSAVPAGRLRRMGVPPGALTWLRRAVAEEEVELAQAIRPIPPGSGDLAAILAALVAVVAGSVLMERSAAKLGSHFGLSSLVVGGVILAAVTSLPNAVGAVVLASRGRGAALLSEAMNSNMINVVAGLLLPGLFVGLAAPNATGNLVAAWYAALTAVSLSLAYARTGLDRRDGAIIVSGYAAFLAVAVLR